MDIEFKDNSKEILNAMDKALQRGLKAIGMTAEGYAKDLTPVDTGRLRNSITWATKEREGTSYSYKDKNQDEYTDTIGSGAEKGDVYIGTNVEYAPKIEFGERGGTAHHMLKKAVTEHADKYKSLIEDSLKNA